jgi:hypothetical protein
VLVFGSKNHSMKKLNIIILCTIWLGLTSLSPQPFETLSKKETKKVNKLLGKHWDIEGIEIIPIVLPDEVDNHLKAEFPPHSLFTIKFKNETTSFLTIVDARGCVIGGCDTDQCTNGQCSPYDEAKAYEEFTYATIFDTSLMIKGISVIKYEAQHGFEICSRSWLKQFEGVDHTVTYGKEIDAISGATISGTNLTESINHIRRELYILKTKGWIK